MSTQQPDPPLPRKPVDLSEIRRLRREALEHLDAEERPSPGVVYGGPAPVYGGPAFGGSVTRRWTLRRILLLIAALLAGLGATLFGVKRFAAPVYGGPPVPPQPSPDGSVDKHPNPVYGGPVPPRPLERKGKPSPKPHRPAPAPNPVVVPSAPSPQPTAIKPAAAVYGGPVPRPQPPQNHPSAPVYGGPVPRPVPPPQPAPTPNTPATSPQDPQ
jgi:hypothetical protein